MLNRVLIVCVGNICRSPVAQFALHQRLPALEVQSAGLAAVVGSDMSSEARMVAESHGIPCPPHQARQLTVEMCRWADLILVMEHSHRRDVSRMFPEMRGKTFLLGALMSQSGVDVPDPHGQKTEVFERVHGLISSAVDSWAQKLDTKAR